MFEAHGNFDELGPLARAQKMRTDELRWMEVNELYETAFLYSYFPPREWLNGFQPQSPKASSVPVGPSLTASRAVEPVANPALMPRGTGRRAPSVAAASASLEITTIRVCVVLHVSRRRRRALHRVGRDRRCPGRSGLVWLETRISRRKFRSHGQSYKRRLICGC